MGIDIQPPGPAQESGAGAQSVSAHGTAAAPGAAATILSMGIGSFQAGTRYQIDVYYLVNGTAATPADDDNMTLSFNAVNVLNLAWNGGQAGTGAPQKATFITPPHNGVSSVQIKSVGAASAGTVYHATIVATPVGD